MRQAKMEHVIDVPEAVSRQLELGALLAALAGVLQETIGRFTDVSGRVTERVLVDGRSNDLTLIVALQDFDRLQQEFVALAELVTHCAARVCGSQMDAAHDPLASITLADLKQRLGDRVSNETLLMAEDDDVDEAIF